MPMKTVVDASVLIDKDFQFTGIDEVFIPTSIKNELKDKSSVDFYQFCGLVITVRDPKPEYVSEVIEFIRDKHYGLSFPDIDVVALSLEVSDEIYGQWIDSSSVQRKDQFICLTKDNGIKAALTALNIYTDPNFKTHKYRLRCFACFTMYDKQLDFCRKCGHNTITRVSVSGEGENEQVHLVSNYKFKPRVIKDQKGNVFHSADQPEYIRFKERQARGGSFYKN